MAKKYTSRKAAIDAVQKVLFAEDGYCEKKSNSNLRSKTANAGSANITKYWKDLNDWGLMGKPNGWAGGSDWSWCAGLQSWAFIKAFGKEAAKEILLHLPFISCQTMAEKAHAKGQLVSDPKRGDLVDFWNGKRYHHTAFVYKVTKTKFYTVEGNTSPAKKVVPNGGQVCKKCYSISAAKKAGHKFIRLKYAPAIKKPKPAKVIESVKKPSETKKETSATKATTAKKTATTKKAVYKKVATKINPLNCRKSPSLKGSILGKFKKGSKIEVLAKANNSFTKVKGKTINGKTITGYVMTKYLK